MAAFTQLHCSIKYSYLHHVVEEVNNVGAGDVYVCC